MPHHGELKNFVDYKRNLGIFGCVPFETKAQRNVAEKRINEDNSLAIGFRANVVEDVGHTHLDLVGNGWYPGVVIEFDHLLGAHKIEVT